MFYKQLSPQMLLSISQDRWCFASVFALLTTLPMEGWEQGLVGTATVLGMTPLENPAE